MKFIQHFTSLIGLLQSLVPPKLFVLGNIRSKQKVFVKCCFIRWNNENGEIQIFENRGRGIQPPKSYI